MGLQTFHIFPMQSPTLAHSWRHIEAIVCCLCYTNIEALEAAVTELWGLMSEGVYKPVMCIVLINNWRLILSLMVG